MRKQRVAIVLIAAGLVCFTQWQAAADQKKEKPANQSVFSVETQGMAVVRLPADGARVLITTRVRMPTLKETTSQEERLVAKLEESWKQWKNGNLKWRLLDQRLQALRQLDPNLPVPDVSEVPVVGYVAWRVYQLEITGLSGGDLQNGVRELQKLALEHGATPGLLLPPTALNFLGPELPRPEEFRFVRDVAYFVKDPDAAYQEALKKARANAVAKAQVLAGNRVPTRVVIQEVVAAPNNELGSEQIVPYIRDTFLPGNRATDRVSSSSEVQIVAVVRAVCEF